MPCRKGEASAQKAWDGTQGAMIYLNLCRARNPMSFIAISYDVTIASQRHFSAAQGHTKPAMRPCFCTHGKKSIKPGLLTVQFDSAQEAASQQMQARIFSHDRCHGGTHLAQDRWHAARRASPCRRDT